MTHNPRQSPAHLARNPFGRVPVLTLPDGFTLYESRAICKFLAAKYSLPYIPPAEDLAARALFDQAESIEATLFTPAADSISYERFAKATMGLQSDEARVGEARKRLEAAFGVMEGVLGGQEWMAGREFSMVDVCYVIIVERLRGCGEVGLFSGENVSAWWERCLGRPRVREFLGSLLSLEDIKKRLAAART
jgi:glutathione S-transferase